MDKILVQRTQITTMEVKPIQRPLKIIILVVMTLIHKMRVCGPKLSLVVISLRSVLSIITIGNKD